MTCATAIAATTSSLAKADPTASARRLPPAASFYLLASIPMSFLASSSALTPLYPIYQAQWGFTPTTVTVVFAIYAIAVLASLLVVGRLSDHLGRRPVLLAAVAAQAAAMALFATAGGVADLLVARVIQGLATGAAVAAVGAGLLDLDKGRGTIANTVATPIGTAAGAVLAGLMVQYLPSPTHLVYVLMGAILVLQGAGVLYMKETHTPRAGALASLRPQLSLSPAVRQPMLLALPAFVATWALPGLYGSLGPALVRGLAGASSPLLGGLSLAVLAGSAAVAVLLLRRRDPHTLTLFGSSALLAGLAIAIAAITFHSAGAFFVGTSLAGMGFGAAFQGAIRNVANTAGPHERAGVLSVALVVSYLAMGLPAIVAGYLVTRQGDILTTAREYGAVVMVLAALTLVGAMRRRPA